jgi:transaldolase
MKIFADCAEPKTMIALAPEVDGFTTNPTLMRQAGVYDYETFARGVLEAIQDKPISFEVIADTFPEMERQAHKIQSWGLNAVVKIPITNTRGESSFPLIERLVDRGVSVNVTAVMTGDQATMALDAEPAILSIFAGRIADTGVDPLPIVEEAVYEAVVTEILWASTRELLNIKQAESVGCHIITLSPELLRKRSVMGRSRDLYSRETVQQFYEDAKKAGYTL